MCIEVIKNTIFTILGDCICAPFVTGTEELPCSQCEENTFGYDPITGCQECKCMIEGTLQGNKSKLVQYYITRCPECKYIV